MLFVGPTRSGRVAAKRLLILPELFLIHRATAALGKLATAVSGAQLRIRGRRVDADLCLPVTDGRHGSLILYTGTFGLRL
jgi:hypothetical protein